jgi:hypothetical protein
LQAQSLTYCGKEMVASASARGSTLCQHNHLQAVGRQRQHQHQQGGMHFANTITYFLWKGNGRISISKGVCTLQAQPLTSCGKEMEGSALARGSALCKHNHLHTVGRKWQDQHQQRGLNFASKVTYSLWEGNGRISISKEVCTLQAQSLTSCEKEIAASASVMGSALCKYNHLHTAGRKWQHQHQQGGLHCASTITYNLWECNGRISISKGVCTLQAQSLTTCGKAMARSALIRGSALCKHNHLLAVGRQWQN